MSNETTKSTGLPVIPAFCDADTCENFYIKDVKNLLGASLKDGEYCKKYPLFLMDDDDYFHINYEGVMEKFMNMKDVLFKIEVSFGEYSHAYGVYKPENIRVHVAGTELEAIERFSGGRDYDGSDFKNVIRIRACDIDNLKWVHVKVVPASYIRHTSYKDKEDNDEV